MTQCDILYGFLSEPSNDRGGEEECQKSNESFEEQERQGQY